VVILMQENRSFDHYFGTLRRVRGFGDKQLRSGAVELTLANEGQQAVTYTLAGRSVRLLRRGDHRRFSRRLPPPLRGPHHLNGGFCRRSVG
jgi:phosphoesterase family protein